MKTVLFLLGIALTLNTVAQKNGSKIVLTKGQKIIIKTTATQEADMGMGMQMKNFSTTQNDLLVLNTDDAVNYSISNTLTGVKLSMEFMGQSTTYDSDKKEDSASELGKSMTKLNVPDTVELNKSTVTVTSKKKEEASTKEDANPIEGMFESLGNKEDAVVSEAFFVIPKEKKIGDKWQDSVITKGMKSYKTYTLTSIDKGIAALSIDGKVINTTQTEEQGMQITVNITMTSNSEVTVDTKTGIVKKRDTKADISGNLEMAGQEMPITGKATITTVYE